MKPLIDIIQEELDKILAERVKHFVKGGKEVKVKDKCRGYRKAKKGEDNYGGFPYCNQMDINSLEFSDIKEDEVKTKNEPFPNSETSSGDKKLRIETIPSDVDIPKFKDQKVDY